MAETVRNIRYDRLQIKRLKAQLVNAASDLTNIENLSKLQALVDEFRTLKLAFEVNIGEYVKALDEADTNYEKMTSALMKELTEASDILATYEGKVKAFHRTLEGQANRDSLIPPESNQSFHHGTSSIQPKVKRIEVPTFDGNLLDFTNFRGLYENLVHNNSELSNVQKLYYLKQAMTGSAAEIVRDFELTDNAYVQAWSCVLKRFENKRLVVKTLFRKLIDIEPIKNEGKIRSLLDQFDVIVRSLKSNGEPVGGTFSKFVAFLITSRLDFRTARDFENSINASEPYPMYDQVQKFLTNRAVAADDFASSANKTSKESSSSKATSLSTPVASTNKPREKRSFTSTVSATLKCVVCSQAHYLNQCEQFSKKNVEERFNVVKRNKLCLRCFNPFHRVSDCTRPKCDVCDGNHHKMLHREERKPESSQTSKSNVVESYPSERMSLSVVACENANKMVILPTAVVQVRVQTKVGPCIRPARVMLDHGSQATLISETFVRQNSIVVQKTANPIKIGGITGSSMPSEYFVKAKLVSRHNSFELNIEADMVQNIPYFIERYAIDRTMCASSNLKFAESKLQSDRVDIIVGAEFYEKCIRDRSESVGSVFLRDTEFGWVISGPYIVNKGAEKSFCGVTVLDVLTQLKKFWEIEEADVPQNTQNKLEFQQCAEFVSKTLQRQEDGRFVAKLPMKMDREQLGESKPKAVAALKRIETKYEPNLSEQYVRVIDEYLELRHMEEVIASTSSTYYIPHRAVVKPTSTTTKVRVVFNASCPTSTGISLNDVLMVGPRIQPELVEILIRFR